MIKNALKWAADRAVSLAAIALSVAALSLPIRAQLNAPQTWAGLAGGTSSALVLTIHNVNQASDIVAVPLRFFPNGTNAGPVTVAVSIDGGGTIGPYALVKQTTNGLTALVGNELQTTQITSVMLDGSTNCSGGPCFQCLTCAPTVPAGSMTDFLGPVIPAGWLKADGSAVSRTTYNVLFNALFPYQNVAATTNNGQASIVVSSSSFQLGWFVGGSNIPCNSQITSIPDSGHVVINNNATNGGSTSLTFGPYPQGDCATTFNLPQFSGQASVGVDGTGTITGAGCQPTFGNVATLGVGCGTQISSLTIGNLPPFTPSGTIGVTGNPTFTGTAQNTGPSSGTTGGILSSTASGATSTYTPAGAISGGSYSFTGNTIGGGLSFTNLPPIRLVYKIVKT